MIIKNQLNPNTSNSKGVWHIPCQNNQAILTAIKEKNNVT